MLSKILVACTALATAAALAPVTLATFDGSATDYHWLEENDPVMGGVSINCTFTKDAAAKAAVFSGVVEIVPSLKAPGFCFARTDKTKRGSFPDVSGYKNLGLVVRNSAPYENFKVCFAADTLEVQFKCFKADVVIPQSADFATVSIPFANFSKSWNQATGEPTKDDPPSLSPLSPVSAEL
jgi:hypothetical protein